MSSSGRASGPDKAGPIIGMALWLLKGPLGDRIEWLIENGFTGVSCLQSVMEAGEAERDKAALMIRQAGLHVTYHGNVGHKLIDGDRLDHDYVERVVEDVRWWDSRTNGVASVCFDPIHTDDGEGGRRFVPDLNRQVVSIMSKLLRNTGIRVGIENLYGGGGAFCSNRQFQTFLGQCPGPALGMLLDLGHANIHVRSDGTPGEDNIEAYLAAIPLDILEVHVSDNLGRQDEHRQAGYGNLELAAAVGAIKRRGFRSQITVEVCVDILSGQYGADLDNPAELEAIRTTRDAIAKAWDESPQ